MDFQHKLQVYLFSHMESQFVMYTFVPENTFHSQKLRHVFFMDVNRYATRSKMEGGEKGQQSF